MDIHSGGIDLCFPHHDNEIAQSEGYYKCKQVDICSRSFAAICSVNIFLVGQLLLAQWPFAHRRSENVEIVKELCYNS